MSKERIGHAAASRLWAGASGYSYKEWKGTFYPEDIKPDAMLKWYAERLPTVEINNTFYQMPKTGVLENWAKCTPEGFRFAIKASRRITHMARLKAETAADSVAYLYKNLATLGHKRGPVLFQLPPFLKKDVPRLSEFLRLLPENHCAAFEFRNESWFADDVYDALKGPGRPVLFGARGHTPPLWCQPLHGATSGCDSKPTRIVICSSGPAGSRPRRGRRLTYISCTNRRHRLMRRP